MFVLLIFNDYLSLINYDNFRNYVRTTHEIYSCNSQQSARKGSTKIPFFPIVYKSAHEGRYHLKTSNLNEKMSILTVQEMYQK